VLIRADCDHFGAPWAEVVWLVMIWGMAAAGPEVSVPPRLVQPPQVLPLKCRVYSALSVPRRNRSMVPSFSDEAAGLLEVWPPRDDQPLQVAPQLPLCFQ
jgi:hypothetical protein